MSRLNNRGKRIYVAGDTELTPEMKAIKDIDVAFLPLSPPYGMTQDMVAEAVHIMKPRILFPYHCNDADPAKLMERLKDETTTDVRTRCVRLPQ